MTQQIENPDLVSPNGAAYFKQITDSTQYASAMRQYSKLEDAFTAWPTVLNGFTADAETMINPALFIRRRNSTVLPIDQTVTNAGAYDHVYINAVTNQVETYRALNSATYFNFKIKNTLEQDLLLAYSKFDNAYAGANANTNRGPHNALSRLMPLLWTDANEM